MRADPPDRDQPDQAVAKLNATGQHSADLRAYAAESIRRADRLDAAAERYGRPSGELSAVQSWTVPARVRSGRGAVVRARPGLARPAFRIIPATGIAFRPAGHVPRGPDRRVPAVPGREREGHPPRARRATAGDVAPRGHHGRSVCGQ